LSNPPCSSRATWSWLLRTVSRRFLDNLMEEDPTASLGDLCRHLVTLTVKEWYLMFRGTFLCSSLCLLPLVLSLGTRLFSEPGSILFALSLQVFVHTDKNPPSLLFSRLTSPSSLSHSSQERCSSPFITLVALHRTGSRMSVSLILRSPALDPALQVWPHQCRVEGKNPLPQGSCRTLRPSIFLW